MRLLILALALVAGATPAYAVSGGETVDISTVPYVVGLGGCTGTLIAPDRVLTAAHCVTSYDRPDRIGVVVGQDKNTRRSGGFARGRGVVIMPGYKLQYPFAHTSPQNATAVNDVALVLLAKPVENITPIRVAGPGDAALEQPGAPVRLLGYGETGTGDVFSPLQGGDLTLISKPDCLKAYPRAVVDIEICAQDVSHDGALTQPCPGDSGGPLIAQTPDGPVQLGVTSWASEVKDKACGKARLPGVWMRLSSFYAFITDPDPVVPPWTAEKVRITGSRRLTCSTPKFNGSPGKVTYAWGVPRYPDSVLRELPHPLVRYKGATAKHFTVSARSRGRKLVCAVTATNAAGRWTAYSAAIKA
jgi:secreted trypsin-like serine protease